MVWKAYNNSFGTGFATADDEKRFTELGGRRRPLVGGEYFGDGEYKTVAGLDPNRPGWEQRVEPGYELAGYLSDNGNFANPSTRNPWAMLAGAPMSGSDVKVGVLRRKAAAPTPAPSPTPAPTPAPTPTPPAPRVDATGPSLADALRDQRQQAGQRPALQQALDSALRINDWRDAGGEQQGASGQDRSRGDSSGDGGRRFAASDRWRQRLEEVSSRFA